MKMRKENRRFTETDGPSDYIYAGAAKEVNDMEFSNSPQTEEFLVIYHTFRYTQKTLLIGFIFL